MRPVHVAMLSLIVLAGPLRAQDEAAGLPWGSAYLSWGVFADHRTHLFPGDIARLTPGSVLLDRDMSDHLFRQGTFSPGGAFHVSVGFHPFRNEMAKGPELRLGFLSTSQQGISARYERSVHMPYDTLTSSQTGIQYLVDSVTSSAYEITYWYNMAGIHGAAIWRTKRRFSFFGGIGVAAGALYKVHSVVEYRYRASIESAGLSGPAQGPLEGTEPVREENFPLGAGYWWQWHLPMGMDYRLHRDHDLWGRMHLYYEIVPQMLFVQRPALRFTSGIGVQSLFGLRLKL